MKSIADYKFNMPKIVEFFIDKVENIVQTGDGYSIFSFSHIVF